MPADPPAPDHQIEELRRAITRLGFKSRLRVLEGLSDGLVIEEPGGIRFNCRSMAEFKRIRKHKPWDEPLDEWVRSFTPSDVFFDIGANIGAFALLAGKFHFGKVPVFAFEPGFETFAALVRNVLLNDLGGVITALQIGLFDQTGLQPFHYHEVAAGSALHAMGTPVDYRGRDFTPAATQRLPAFRLDDLMDTLALPRPTRIKVDVDGGEARVVAGAVRTLSRGPCELWVEFVERRADDPGPVNVANLLVSIGFRQTRRVDHARSGSYPHVYDALFVR
jgi:FkbM family methyltransferase